MFTYVDATVPHLLAEWRMDGEASDTAPWQGSGVTIGVVSFATDSPLPKDVTIPLKGSPALDGACTGSEYANAVQLSIGSNTVFYSIQPPTCGSVCPPCRAAALLSAFISIPN
jgi:hypothetical protein